MKQANNIDQFLKILDRYNEYNEIYYRGQSAQYKSITASIARNKGYIKNEYLIYNESISMKKDEFKTLTYPIERLSKLQHYGIPTRLIDITINPLIALFFAIQDINNEYASYVYVYIQKSYSMDSKHVKLLALLATLKKYDIQFIKESYQKQYDSFISEKEIIDFAQESVFVKYSEGLKKTNSRLYNQKGTFVICGNDIKDNIIQNKIKPLDSIKPTIIIYIPFEHKMSIKRELDKKYGINETMIYPELPSVANYIREKYSFENFTMEGTYNIIEKDDVSHTAAKRISLVIVLQKKLRIEQIKRIAIEVINEYKIKNDVVWIYIAKNGDDYIMYNWILCGQWISPELDSKFSPMSLNNPDEEGYSWVFEDSYDTLGKYYEENVFDENKNLFVYHQKIYDFVLPIFKMLYNRFKSKDLKEFIIDVNKQKEKINYVYKILGEIGHSRNKDFDDFLYNYENALIPLDDLKFWANKEELNEKAMKYQINNCFKEAKKYFDIIEHQSNLWKKQFEISRDDYESIDPFNIQKKQYQYEQTIPLNPNALIVNFNVKILTKPDNTFEVVGETNLFDKANLMVSIRKEKGKLLGQSKSEVVDGRFNFGLFSNKGNGYKPGYYKAVISLSIPNVQPEEFIKKAGIEYENLSGPYIDRTGIGPTLKYEVKFNIN